MSKEEIEAFDEDAELYEHFKVVADKNQSQVRIDKFLMDKMPNVTRTKIQNGIDSGAITVNGSPTKSSYKVRPLDEIVVSMPTPPREDVVVPENIPLNIVYEDEEVLVINKEPGMVVHPAHGNWNGTLVNALAYHFQNLPTSQNGVGRPGLVHRIDKETSGLLVIAKTEFAMAHLAKQFYDHSIERTYYALVWGSLPQEEGTVHEWLGRSPKDRRISIVYPRESEYGREAITHYKVLKNMHYVSLVQCNLETGRTHQIRVHLKHIGNTLFNDTMYGGDKVLKGTVFAKYKQFVDNCFKIMPRQALHAKSLGFNHPKTKKWMQFDSEIPEDMASVIAKWEGYVENHELS